MTKNYTIDASNKTVGYIASKVATILIGKDSTSYSPNKIPDIKVEIINASKTKMSESRKNNTLHERYSGYPGGFKTETNEKILNKKGWKALYELAVYGMLPSNKLRPLMMKRLSIKD